MMPETMSNKRLAQIWAILNGLQYGTLTITSAGEHTTDAYDAYHGARQAITDLLAEVERLRAENAALTTDVRDGAQALLRTHRILSKAWEIVRQVAQVHLDDPSTVRTIRHQARELMAQRDTPEGEGKHA